MKERLILCFKTEDNEGKKLVKVYTTEENNDNINKVTYSRLYIDIPNSPLYRIIGYTFEIRFKDGSMKKVMCALDGKLFNKLNEKLYIITVDNK